MDEVMNGLAMTGQPVARDRPAADVALLAATALGFAYATSGSDELHATRLATLADQQPEALSRAEAAVLALEIASSPERAQAAILLRRAASKGAGADRHTDLHASGAQAAARVEVRP